MIGGTRGQIRSCGVHSICPNNEPFCSSELGEAPVGDPAHSHSVPNPGPCTEDIQHALPKAPFTEHSATVHQPTDGLADSLATFQQSLPLSLAQLVTQ